MSKWGKQMLERYDKCAICGSKKELEPHHVFETQYHDEFHNSISNGLVLCHDCHHEYHQQNYGNINLKSLLDFKHNHEVQACRSLEKENKKLHNQIKNIRKRMKKELSQHYEGNEKTILDIANKLNIKLG